MEDNLGLRAEDPSPRSDAPRDFRTAARVRPRQEARLVYRALSQLILAQLRGEPARASIARLVRSALRQLVAILSASRSAFISIAPRAASASLDTASVSLTSGLAHSSA